MDKAVVVQELKNIGLVPVLRAESVDKALALAGVLGADGVAGRGGCGEGVSGERDGGGEVPDSGEGAAAAYRDDSYGWGFSGYCCGVPAGWRVCAGRGLGSGGCEGYGGGQAGAGDGEREEESGDLEKSSIQNLKKHFIVTA